MIRSNRIKYNDIQQNTEKKTRIPNDPERDKRFSLTLSTQTKMREKELDTDRCHLPQVWSWDKFNERVKLGQDGPPPGPPLLLHGTSLGGIICGSLR